MTEDRDWLVWQAKSGDKEALEQLISRNERRIYNYIYKLTGDPHDAADLTQETFLRVCTSIRYFRGEASFVSWLYKIASNVCVDRARRRTRKRTLSIDAPLTLEDGECAWVLRDDSPEPDVIAESTEVREFVRRGIAALPVDYRTVVVLHDLQDLSYREIADVVGCPIGTVKSRLNRGRRALKQGLMGRGAREYLGGGWDVDGCLARAPRLLPVS